VVKIRITSVDKIFLLLIPSYEQYVNYSGDIIEIHRPGKRLSNL